MTVFSFRFIGIATAFALIAPSTASGQDAATASLRALRDQDQRVLAVSHRLKVGAAELCAAAARPDAGWILHDLGQYRPGLRPAAERLFGLQSGQVGVLALAPDGPAARAGVRRDDVVLSVGGTRLGEAPTADVATAEASHGLMGRTGAHVAHALSLSPVPVEVRRDGRTLRLDLAPTRQCPWPVQVQPSDQLEAGSDGRQVSISSRLAAYLADDGELAAILGHEMAHNLLGHPPPPRGLAAQWLGRGRAEALARERAADRVGLFLAARAGYDVSSADDFFRRLGRDYLAARFASARHPSSGERAQLAEAVQAEIEALRAEGRPLIP